MSSVRQHLSDFHKGMASHHEFLGDHSGKLSGCFADMSKAAGKSDGEMYSKIATHFDAMAKRHHDAAELNSECADACMKAQEDSLNKITPDSLSSVGTTDSFGIRAVVRQEQPTADHGINKAAIPPQFQHLISADEV